MYDSTLALLAKGYAWLPDRRRRDGGAPVRTRLLGKPAIALHGVDAVRFFYDETHVRRTSALPEPVVDTLFGQGAVHTLDGEEHRVRKAMFVSLLKDRERVAALVHRVEEEWERARADWAKREQLVLFDEVSKVLTRSVCSWAGIPDAIGADDGTAADLVAMVDGFATAGPRHWRARRARARQEERLGRLVTECRTTGAPAGVSEGSILMSVASHRDSDGSLLDARTAAVELLNVIRPTVAVTWFVTFAAHATHRWPDVRERLASGDASYALAFAQEVRRFYPFAPFVGGLAVADLRWHDEPIAEGTMVLLDIYGQNHDPELWDDPYVFSPQRFVDREPGRDELIPQGGGEADAGHRCPGEDITLAVLTALGPRLAGLEYDVPEQDLSIPLRRVPTRPRSGFVVSGVRG
ncbi:cytochrome P450 [Streptomyces sp. DT24]|uniref:cytochrome P450 n=1 Tax=Streptomyces sp. DT24 TaxID=3416520 RepID=UPI003CEE1937